MKKSGRYRTAHLIEDQFEPGSKDRVLKNKVGITSTQEMHRHEKESQLHAMEKLVDLFDRNHRFTANDICKMHKIWLGGIYEWAGKYRQVKMSKNDFSFAFPEQIPKLMSEFEKGPLRELTPCLLNPARIDLQSNALCDTGLIFSSNAFRCILLIITTTTNHCLFCP